MKVDFSKQSDEELHKKIKIGKLVTGMLIGALTILLVINSLVKEKSFWEIIVMPLCLSPIVVINISNIVAMKKELESRNKSTELLD